MPDPDEATALTLLADFGEEAFERAMTVRIAAAKDGLRDDALTLAVDELLNVARLKAPPRKTPMLSAHQIAVGKAAHPYTDAGQIHHEHDDCVRLAYEWLDAQVKTKGRLKGHWALKHIIEKWAGRYVSQSDVELAAHLHPSIRGQYPHFNISSRFTRPNARRLSSIGEAGVHPNYRKRRGLDDYKRDED